MNNFNAVLLGLIILVIAVFTADQIIGKRELPPRTASETQAIAERIRPPGQVATKQPSAPSAPLPVITSPIVTTPDTATVPPQASSAPSEISEVVEPPRETPPPVVAITPQPTAEASPESTPVTTDDFAKSKQIYVSACFACHETGAAAAPQRNDPAAWQERRTQGKNVLLSHVLQGFKNMPRRGGNPNLTDNEIAMATAYLLLNSDQ